MTTEERVAKNEAAIEGQHAWNERQNGSLDRIEHKVDSLYNRVLLGLGTAILLTVVNIVLGRI